MDSSFQRGSASRGPHGRAGKTPKSKVSQGKKEPLSGEKSWKPGRLALGAALATLRIRKSLSKSGLARKAGIKPKLLSGYEQGTTTPRPPMLERIAEALGSSVEEIHALAELHSSASRTEGAAAAARAVRMSALLTRAEAALAPGMPAPRVSGAQEDAQALRERLRPYSLAEQRAIVLGDETFHRQDLSGLLRGEGMTELADWIAALVKAGDAAA